ncbi:MAG TPA: hypothetical protein PLD20_24060, partial [Blastocatellia bacterium]|nr:hypothetical protein [Blastocatellia bacterium]
MFKKYFRHSLVYSLVILFAVAVLATLIFNAGSRAQHRAEARPSAAKPKTKPAPAPSVRSHTARQQINADGSIIGTPWIGEPSITETTADIQSRTDSRSAELRLSSYVERPRRNRQPQRDHLPQHPEALPGAQWPPVGEGETGRRGEGETGRRGDGEKEDVRSSSPSLPFSQSPSLSFTAGTLSSV